MSRFRHAVLPRILLGGLVLLLIPACRPTRFFYYPNRVLYADPEKMGMPYTLLEIPSLNGKKLSALLFQTEGTPLGTVVHFHGNFANVSNHFLQSHFLTRFGFDVIIFDYQGYGGSQGVATPARTVEDGQAVVRYAQRTLRNSVDGGVVVLGQSLGAAVATVVVALEKEVRGVVLESGFSSYRSMARSVLSRSFLLWPLYPVYPFLLPNRYDAQRWVGRIAPRPVLFIHGDRDRIVPLEMSRRLYRKALAPKDFWIIEGADHLQCRRIDPSKYEQRVVNFFREALNQK